MYICICKQITDKQINNAIENGVNTLQAIRSTLGASTECGNCTDCIKDMIAEYCIPIANIQIINSALPSTSIALSTI